MNLPTPMPGDRRWHWIQTVICLLLAGTVVTGLKLHYSRAGSEALGWVLEPTAFWVSRLSGIPFHEEVGSGFVNQTLGLVIAPACAGVNFMIAAYGTVVFACIPGSGRFIFNLFWISAGWVGAYAATLAVNTMRIIASIYLYRAPIYNGWLTPDRVHRVAGIVIYLTALCLLYSFATVSASTMKQWGRRHKGGLADASFFRKRAVPFVFYLAVTLVVPVVRSIGLQKHLPAAEHSLTVIAVCIVVAAVEYGLRRGRNGWFMATTSPGRLREKPSLQNAPLGAIPN